MRDKEMLLPCLIIIWALWIFCVAPARGETGPFERGWADRVPHQEWTSPTIDNYAAQVLKKVRELDTMLADHPSAYAVLLTVADYYEGVYRLVPGYGLMSTVVRDGKTYYEREWVVLDMDLRVDETPVIIIKATQVFELQSFYNREDV